MNDLNPVPEKPASKRRPPIWAWIIVALALALVACCILPNWLFNVTTARFLVEGSSMEPTFHKGQRLIINRLAYLSSPPQRGDLIVFQYPGNATDEYIKRIIGIPGDTIVTEGDHVQLNGVLLVEPYISLEPGSQGRPGRWIVPADSYFVMGDNRGHSSDSRTWGMLPKSDIIGKVWLPY